MHIEGQKCCVGQMYKTKIPITNSWGIYWITELKDCLLVGFYPTYWQITNCMYTSFPVLISMIKMLPPTGLRDLLVNYRVRASGSETLNPEIMSCKYIFPKTNWFHIRVNFVFNNFSSTCWLLITIYYMAAIVCALWLVLLVVCNPPVYQPTGITDFSRTVFFFF